MSRVVSQASRACTLFASVATDTALRSRVREVAAISGSTPSSTLNLDCCRKAIEAARYASAFALTPEVILLDNPPAAVSSGDKHGIHAHADAAANTRACSNHFGRARYEFVAEYSTRIVALKEGRVLADLPPQQFFNDPHCCRRRRQAGRKNVATGGLMLASIN